jgi:hypothetical protein
MMNATHVFTAYLKNSVTRSVDPLRVIDWRMAACFVGGIVEDRTDERGLLPVQLVCHRRVPNTKARHPRVPREQNGCIALRYYNAQ